MVSGGGNGPHRTRGADDGEGAELWSLGDSNS
jgi:hypothetical protein